MTELKRTASSAAVSSTPSSGVDDDRIRAMLTATAGPPDPIAVPRRARRLRSPKKFMLVAAVLALVPLAIAEASSRFDGPRVSDPVPRTETLPFGPATIAVAKLTRVYFDCMVEQGAHLRRDDRDTVVLDDDTPGMHTACSQQYEAVLAAQNTAGAKEERAARTALIQEWDRCATADRAAGASDDLQRLLDACETKILKANGQEAAAARIQEIITPGAP